MSTITFSATRHTAPIQLRKDLRKKKIEHLVLNILSCGIYALGSLIMNRIKRKLVPLLYMPAIQRRKGKCEAYPEKTIETLDHVKLDARTWRHPSKSQQWLVYFCPNGHCYEDLIDRKIDLANLLGVNILLFNYRNVGYSEGKFYYGRELIMDGSAIIEYLKKKKNVPEDRITLIGHSMGGGVACALTKYYPKVKHINDRSYSKIARVAPNSSLQLLVQVSGLNIDAITPWMNVPESQKMIIYNPNDTVIPHKKAGLYAAIKEQLKKRYPKQCLQKRRDDSGLADELKPRRLKVKAHHADDLFGNEREQFIKKARELIHGVS